MLPTIYSNEITDYLEAAGFERTDQGISVDFMSWKKGNQVIQFEGQLLKAITEHSKWDKQTTHTLQGFKQNDLLVFVLIMNSWGIISIETMRNLQPKTITDHGNRN